MTEIPVTHVGSLIRPDALVELLRTKREGGDVPADELAACLDRCVAEVVQHQVEAGIDIVDDGEFGKRCRKATGS